MNKIPKYSIIVSDKLPNILGIHIEDGEFQGVFVSVGNISYDSMDDRIYSEVYVVRKPKDITDEMLESIRFNVVVESICKIILEETYDENGNNHTESFDDV